jgi:hypothetical protein
MTQDFILGYFHSLPAGGADGWRKVGFAEEILQG